MDQVFAPMASGAVVDGCSSCGSLVKLDEFANHARWHESLGDFTASPAGQPRLVGAAPSAN